MLCGRTTFVQVDRHLEGRTAWLRYSSATIALRETRTAKRNGRRLQLAAASVILFEGASAIRQFVGRAAPTARRLGQHAQIQQLGDVAQRGIRRAFGQGCPLAAGELAVESIE